MLAIGCLELDGGRGAGGFRRRDLRHDAGRAARHAARFRRSAFMPRARIPARWKAPRACGGCSKAARSAQSHIACRRVQDAYSLRCAPQVHGAVRDTLAEARRVFAIELNSATDNPLVFDDEILSGGNFHGEPLAFQLDFLAVALTALAGISERRIDRLVNPALNEELAAVSGGPRRGWNRG